MKTGQRWNKKIPFGLKNNQLHYANETYPDVTVRSGPRNAYWDEWDVGEWRDNTEWRGKLHITSGGRAGRSAIIFKGNFEDGMRVTIFLSDFMAMVPHMVHGVVEGIFTFCKSGANYGCRLVTPA